MSVDPTKLICPICNSKTEINQWGGNLLSFNLKEYDDLLRCPECKKDSTVREIIKHEVLKLIDNEY